MNRLKHRIALPLLVAAGFAGTVHAAPSLHFQMINGSSQLAGIDALQIADKLYDVRWNTTLNYYDTYSFANPLSPTFMSTPAGANDAAAAIAAFINSLGNLPRSVGFQSMLPIDGTGATLPARFIGMIPSAYGYNNQYARWESSGAALQFDASSVLDSNGKVDLGAYHLTAFTGGFGAITNETGPGGRGVITANPGWAFVSFTSLGTVTPALASAVPEPALSILLVTGFAAMARRPRRKCHGAGARITGEAR